MGEGLLVGTAYRSARERTTAPVSDTVKQVNSQHQVQATLPRQGLWLAQTPQVFRREVLLAAFADRGKLGQHITDDAQLVEAAGGDVRVVEAPRENMKVTTAFELQVAELLLSARQP